jgi:hypothetical protein
MRRNRIASGASSRLFSYSWREEDSFGNARSTWPVRRISFLDKADAGCISLGLLGCKGPYVRTNSDICFEIVSFARRCSHLYRSRQIRKRILILQSSV